MTACVTYIVSMAGCLAWEGCFVCQSTLSRPVHTHTHICIMYMCVKIIYVAAVCVCVRGWVDRFAYLDVHSDILRAKRPTSSACAKRPTSSACAKRPTSRTCAKKSPAVHVQKGPPAVHVTYAIPISSRLSSSMPIYSQD